MTPIRIKTRRVKSLMLEKPVRITTLNSEASMTCSTKLTFYKVRPCEMTPWLLATSNLDLIIRNIWPVDR